MIAGMGVLQTWYVVANVLAAVAVLLDKQRAAVGGFRVSERALWLSALGGGFVGGVFAMLLARHKTRKRSFQLKYLAATAVHVYVVFLR